MLYFCYCSSIVHIPTGNIIPTMAINRTAAILISTLVMGHLSYHILRPMFIPPTPDAQTNPIPEKPVFWEPPPKNN